MSENFMLLETCRGYPKIRRLCVRKPRAVCYQSVTTGMHLNLSEARKTNVIRSPGSPTSEQPFYAELSRIHPGCRRYIIAFVYRGPVRQGHMT